MEQAGGVHSARPFLRGVDLAPPHGAVHPADQLTPIGPDMLLWPVRILFRSPQQHHSPQAQPHPPQQKPSTMAGPRSRRASQQDTQEGDQQAAQVTSPRRRSGRLHPEHASPPAPANTQDATRGRKRGASPSEGRAPKGRRRAGPQAGRGDGAAARAAAASATGPLPSPDHRVCQGLFRVVHQHL